MQNTYSMVVYNGRLFEKISTTEEENGMVQHCYLINDKEVSEEEWTQQQKLAIARDVFFARRNKSLPLLIPAKS